jgi:hypothetical protein
MSAPAPVVIAVAEAAHHDVLAVAHVVASLPPSCGSVEPNCVMKAPVSRSRAVVADHDVLAGAHGGYRVRRVRPRMFTKSARRQHDVGVAPRCSR